MPGGFRDFPRRHGWDIHGEPGKPEASKFVRLDGIDASLQLAEKVALLQAWMFFGLIAEASSIYGLEINVEKEFVLTSDDGHNIVSTAPLNGLSDKWVQAAAETAEGLKGRCAKIRELCQYLEPRIFDLRDPNNHARIRLFTYDEAEVLFSIEIAYRVLLLSLVRSGLYDAASIQPLLKTKFFDHQLRLHLRGWRRLQKQGWCHSEMTILSSLNRELPYVFFAGTLKGYPLDHGECRSDFRCNADQINEAVYKTMHADPGCTCKFVGIDIDAVCSILSQNQVPVISISRDLELRASEGLSNKFVAISHVCKS